MKIHLRQIPPGDTLHLEGEAPASMLDIQDELVHGVSPVRYSLDVGLSDGGLFATGSLEVDLELECVRCLRRFSFPVKIDDFAIQTELGTTETVDLTPLAREDILLTLPAHPHCDWNGATRCAGVQEKLKEELDSQRLAPNPSDLTGTDSLRPNPWKALDQLQNL